jgi:hypothetical protein
MEELPPRGNLSETPLASLLYQIWQKEKTGCLRLKDGERAASLYFEKGNPVIERGSFPEKEFLKDLFENNCLDLRALEQCEAHCQKNQVSGIRALVELEILSPFRLWGLIEDFWKEITFPLFDWPRGEFIFESVPVPREGQLVRGISAAMFILEGVRRMQDDVLIRSFLPPEAETIQALSPFYLDELTLGPHEKYLLGLVDGSRSLKTIQLTSELGNSASVKILFSLLSLGIIGTAQQKNRNKAGAEPPPVDVHRVFEAFNEKISYIYKYMSKELGPLALNILDKSLDEVRARLDPLFQNTELNLEGKIQLTLSRANFQVTGEESRKSFFRTLDEILTAEVLAVKKTLGPDHESVLVKNLEKIGELD